MLAVKNLTCVRGDRRLFAGLSFSVSFGEALYVQGANGVGKTTLLRALCGLFQPDEGEVLWRGEAARGGAEAFLREALYIGHRPALKMALSPLENLEVACRLGGMMGGRGGGSVRGGGFNPRRAAAFDINRGASFDDRLMEALARVGLEGYEDAPCGALSLGQQRRAVLARLFLTDAALWVLDEPFNGLDVGAAALARGAIARHVGGGGVAVVAAHGQADWGAVNIKRLALGPRQ